MAIVFGSYTGTQVNTELVPAQPGRIIRVVKLLVSGWTALRLQLLADPGGEAAPLLPQMHIGPGGLVLGLGRHCAVSTGPGQGLGFTATFQGAAASFGVAVWYEVVA